MCRKLSRVVGLGGGRALKRWGFVEGEQILGLLSSEGAGAALMGPLAREGPRLVECSLVAHAHNCSTQEAEAEAHCEFKASLAHIVTSRPIQAT